MEENVWSVARSGSAWRQIIIVLSTLLLFMNGGPARAEDDPAALGRSETYAGVFIGAGLTDNKLVDVDGFANWGDVGSVSDYHDSGLAGGALIGKKFATGFVPLRVEIDGTFGDMSAKTNKLDPEGLDETAKADFQWITTARVGVEQAVGSATVFASGGLAVAGIANSVVDIDFGPNLPARVDPDDSFHDSSTQLGWVIGVGVEAPLADTWTLRLEGSYLDFGQSTYDVNRSGNNACGPGNPRTSCPYKVDNKLAIVRLAIIHRFDW